MIIGGGPTPQARFVHVSAGVTTHMGPTVLPTGGVLAGRLTRFRVGQQLPNPLIAVQTNVIGPRQGYAELLVAADGMIEPDTVLPPGAYSISGEDIPAPFEDFQSTQTGVYQRRASVSADGLMVRAGAITTLTVKGAPPRALDPAIVGALRAGMWCTYERAGIVMTS